MNKSTGNTGLGQQQQLWMKVKELLAAHLNTENCVWRKLGLALQTPLEVLRLCPKKTETLSIVRYLLQDWRLRLGSHAKICNLALLLEHHGWKELAQKLLEEKQKEDDAWKHLTLDNGLVIQFNREIFLEKRAKAKIFYGKFPKKSENLVAVHCSKNAHFHQIAKFTEQGSLGEHVVPLWASGEANTFHWHCFPLPTCNLLQLIDVLIERDKPDLLRVMHQTAMGLEALHKLGIVHGDIKPERVQIYYQTKTDFVAKLCCFFNGNNDKGPGYDAIWKAPENQNQGASPPGDIFSLGKLHYFCTLCYFSSSRAALEKLRKLKCTPLPPIYVHEQLADSLISWMTNKFATKRALASQVVAHPYFWDQTKVLQFIVEVGNLYWFEDEWKLKRRRLLGRMDRAYARFVEEVQRRKYSRYKYSWRLCCGESLLKREWKDPLISSEPDYQYDFGSLNSFVELLRYLHAKRSMSHEEKAQFLEHWVKKKEPNLILTLFCSMVYFAGDMNLKLDDFAQFGGMAEGVEDILGKNLFRFLKEEENEEMSRVKYRHFLEGFSSSSEEEEEEDSTGESDYISTRNLSLNEFLEKRYSGQVETVPGTEISLHFETMGRLGGEGRYSACVFSGYFGGTEAAVKLGQIEKGDNGLEMEAFLEAWRQLKNENVCALLEWKRERVRSRDLVYFCMELACKNESLEGQVTKLDPNLEGTVVIKYLHQVAQGLAFLHEKGLAVGELQPDSVLFFSEGDGLRAKLACFPEARLASSFTRGNLTYEHRLKWMAPEVLREEGEEIRCKFACGPEADVFSFGLVVYWILSGCRWHAFGVNNGNNVLENIKEEGVKMRSLEGRRWICAEMMLGRILDKREDRRVGMGKVLQHPFWWEGEKIMGFLKEVGANLEGTREGGKIDRCWGRYYELVHDPTGKWSWEGIMGLGEEFGEFRTDSVLGLVRFLGERGDLLGMDKVLELFPDLVVILWFVLQLIFKEIGNNGDSHKIEWLQKWVVLGDEKEELCWGDEGMETFLEIWRLEKNRLKSI